MIKSVKKIIKNKVFDKTTGEYLGQICDVAFSKDGKLKGYLMESDSIVPIDVWICPGAVRERDKGKMYVSGYMGEKEEDIITFKKDIFKHNFPKGKGKCLDLKLNEEIGEIAGFVYAESIFRRREETKTNKNSLKGENISIRK